MSEGKSAETLKLIATVIVTMLITFAIAYLGWLGDIGRLNKSVEYLENTSNSTNNDYRKLQDELGNLKDRVMKLESVAKLSKEPNLQQATIASCKFIEPVSSNGTVTIREPGKNQVKLHFENTSSIRNGVAFTAVYGGNYKWYVQKQVSVPVSGDLKVTYFIGENSKPWTVKGNVLDLLVPKDKKAISILRKAEGQPLDQLPEGVRSLCSAPVEIME